jgi:hypothetical protein
LQVQKYLTEKGVVDKTGKIAEAIKSNLIPTGDMAAQNTPVAPNGGYGWDPTIPYSNQPPKESFSNYIPNEAGATYLGGGTAPGSVSNEPWWLSSVQASIPGPGASSFFFRKTSGIFNPEVAVVSPTPQPTVKPIDLGVPPAPVLTPGGLGGGGQSPTARKVL